MIAITHEQPVVDSPLQTHGRAVDERLAASPGFERCKRCIDVVGAVAGIVLLAPVMVLCMAWIRWMDGGPVIYRQWRVGRGGWLFRIYKFRTMTMEAEREGVRFAQRNDPRVIRGCQWMRKSHLDETPQLFNVLLGQMSLVGPRPERPEIFQQWRNVLPGMERRLHGLPGLTGLAQVRNGYTNDLAGARRKLAFDLRYLRRRRVRTDLSLMLRTLPRLWDRSAC